MTENSTPDGERIAKVLSRRGVASRREAERMIAMGEVKVNGKIIEPQKFDSVTQKIQEIDVKTATCGANLFVGVVNYL